MPHTRLPTRADCQALDATDTLAPLRAQFSLPDGVIYLDGNSLGVLPAATPARLAAAVTGEWGEGLIRSWNAAGWIQLPQRVGDKIARLVGADVGEVVAADSTSVNLFKVLSQAMTLASLRHPASRVLLSERSNFPTDLYIAEGLCRERGWSLALAEPEELHDRLAEGGVGVMMLTQVNYRTGRLHDMRSLSAAAHAHGALAVWDLAHSAGALPVALKADGADFAVGCGYKYLNGGPGAPAFVWTRPEHLAALREADRWQPLSGWMGHAAPFRFTPDYRPAEGVGQYLCGTPAVLAMTALECGVDTLLAAEPLGGLPALRTKSLALTELFARLVAARCEGHGLWRVSPEEPGQRGSQVCLSLRPGAGGARDGADLEAQGYAIVQALIARGVIGDFRAGDAWQPPILRFGFTPLYTGFTEVWDAVEHLVQVLERGEWREARFQARAAVT